MKSESFVDVKNRINKEEFVAYLTEHEQDITREYFKLSFANFSYLIHYFELEPLIEELKQRKRKAAYARKAAEKLQTVIDKIPKEKLVQYYITENHSMDNTASHFEITTGELLKLITHYDCRKPKTVSKKLAEQTCQERYGSATYNNREQAEKTCMDKYGVPNPSLIPQFMHNSYITKRERYGADNPNNWRQGHETRIANHGSLEESYRITTEHRKLHCLEMYGVDNMAKLDIVKDQIKASLKKTFQERYGADCYWLTDGAVRSAGSRDSSYNQHFASLLDATNISYNREITVGSFIYDFQVGNYLIEINPAPTHNVSWSPFTDHGIEADYHQRKLQNAVNHNYRCIHVWEWDDWNKIVNLLLQPRERMYARNCKIELVAKKEAKDFINSYHLQGYANDEIRLGLYLGTELVSIMTFGKPRFSNKAQWELIRYCSAKSVIGGASKLFKYFIEHYNPESIVSYCDTSKFVGEVYGKLGFEYVRTSLSSHWYNMKTGQHILDSLLRSRGFDQLFGTNFGKGTSNKELIQQHGFIEIVDSGQSTYMWKKSET